MKLYLNTSGQWIFDGGAIPAGSCRYTLTRSGVLTISLLSGFALYKGNLTDLQREDGTTYSDEAEFLLECGDFFVNPLNPLKEDVEGLQEDVSAIQGGYLGTLLHTDAAPEPGVSGIYKFISAGVVSWLSGTPTVAVGDEVSVVFTDPTYTYTHIQNPYELLVNKTQTLTDSETDYPSGRAVADVIIPAEQVTAESLTVLNRRIEALEIIIANSQYSKIDVLDEFNFFGKTNLILFGVTSPSITPDFIGQFYIDTNAGITYQARGIVSSGDWKQTSN